MEKQEVLNLLQNLIKTPSFSREETATADIIEQFFQQKQIPTERKGNNIWAKNRHFTEGLPTVLLNSVGICFCLKNSAMMSAVAVSSRLNEGFLMRFCSRLIAS